LGTPEAALVTAELAKGASIVAHAAFPGGKSFGSVER